MLDSFCYIFLIFIIYSFIGYLIEITNCSIREKKLVFNRGFFLGPYLPIYGISCLLMGSFIIRYKSDLLTVFVMSAFVCTTVEYITSYVLEKIFKARWWDYSDHRFHINGRVSLTTSLGFGTLGLILVYIFNPFFLKIIPYFTFYLIALI